MPLFSKYASHLAKENGPPWSKSGPSSEGEWAIYAKERGEVLRGRAGHFGDECSPT